jgi:hypothetical protein
MPSADHHPEYPTDAQIEEMWAAYNSSGREGILAFLRKRTLEWEQEELHPQTGPADATKA